MAFRKITIKGDPVRGEALANAAITPGHLIELISTGKVQKQAGNALNHPMMIALENSLAGDEIGTAYAAGDMVQYGVFGSGDEAYVFLSDGENVVIGDELEVGSTDGEFIKRASGVSVATALEALDLSASANTTNGRLRVMIH